MNEERKNLEKSQKIEQCEDEIELIDILKVIWRWKYFILVATILCGLIVLIISINMSKIYNIDMTLMPGIFSIEAGGEKVYIDSSQNIKTLIESGTFNNDILKYLNNIKMDNVPKKLNFKVTKIKSSDIIKVNYETSNIKQGIIIIDHLKELLIEKYRDKAMYFENEYNIKLSILKNEIDYIKTAIQSHKRNVKNYEKRINELIPEIELVKNNTVNLIEERNKLLLNNPKESSMLSALLYSNTIQQNLELLNIYKNEINHYKLKNEEELRNIKISETNIANNLNTIKSLQLKKNNIQNIQILKTGTISPYPIKPKTKLNVILALMAGLFLTMFLSFILEYFRNYKNKKS